MQEEEAKAAKEAQVEFKARPAPSFNNVFKPDLSHTKTTKPEEFTLSAEKRKTKDSQDGGAEAAVATPAVVAVAEGAAVL